MRSQQLAEKAFEIIKSIKKVLLCFSLVGKECFNTRSRPSISDYFGHDSLQCGNNFTYLKIKQIFLNEKVQQKNSGSVSIHTSHCIGKN